MTAINYRFRILLLLLLLCCYSADAAAKVNSTTAPCLPDQASSLLQLKRSFIVANGLSSWQAGTDCCHWEGIICDTALGRVISLDLSEFDLMSRPLDPALFNLTSLRKLNLASIEFINNVRLPASGFEQLTDITHLNFSNTDFIGQIPSGISHLKKLVTLDFSGNHGLYFQEPSFGTFMKNMSNLRELYLDWVNLSSSGSTWSAVLAHSVHQLRILSLPECGLSGSIHPSFSRLRSLTEINLGNNWRLTGKVPEYFSGLSSLTTLDLSGSFFEGQFPTKIFQLKSLRKLDLSMNPMLSVRLTSFPDGNNLQSLNLAGTNFTYDTPLSFASLKSIKTLGLSTMGTTKELLTLITNFPSLDVLQLRGSPYLEKPDELSWVGKLGQLIGLQLTGYDFSQAVPSWISNLTRLESLDISFCTFSMPMPYQIGNLAKLRSLQFMDCDFSRQRMQSWFGNLTKLTSLQIPGCNFSGPIPSTIGNLTQLQYLELTFNYLTGKIPQSLFALPALKILYLDNNMLGSLEDISAPSSSPLWLIDLSGNQLTGPIPKLLFQCTNLQYLFLNSNKLTGTIELSSIWRLKSLIDLSLSNNMISIIDTEGDAIVHSLPSINYLDLASCNLTKFPAALRYLDAILELDLSNNQMKGAIPDWVWETWSYSLNSLDLSHNMFTALEKSPSLVHMTCLTFLDLSSNRIEGTVPIPVITSPPEQVALDYSNNSFSYIVPDFGRYLANVTYINLSNNKLSGHIPPSVCSLNKLDIMDLSFNCFSGPVPSCLIENGHQSVLKLRENKLHGVLPKNIGKGCNFKTIDLSGNGIEGTLPKSLEHCQDLELLDVSNNHIVGSFPSWLGTLPNLRVLVLRSNQFTGSIRDLPSGLKSNNYFTNLQIIDLASNHFSGNLHSEWFESLKSMMDKSNDEGQILGPQTDISRKHIYQDTVTITYKNFELVMTKILTTFKVIDFSDNSFDGPIPESIGRLVSLHGLNMSHNNFVGQIPSQLGDLTRLESLDLSCNHFSGEIPQVLTSLTFLSWLNLSYNNLTGRIPEGNQFFSFPYSSFEGNAGLCGSQVPKQCANSSSTTPRAIDHQESKSLQQDRLDAILLFTFVGLGFGVGFALAILSRIFRRVEGWFCRHFCIHMYV